MSKKEIKKTVKAQLKKVAPAKAVVKKAQPKKPEVKNAVDEQVTKPIIAPAVKEQPKPKHEKKAEPVVSAPAPDIHPIVAMLSKGMSEEEKNKDRRHY